MVLTQNFWTDADEARMVWAELSECAIKRRSRLRIRRRKAIIRDVQPFDTQDANLRGDTPVVPSMRSILCKDGSIHLDYAGHYSTLLNVSQTKRRH